MRSCWDDEHAAAFSGPLGPRVYTSRLLGRDPSLVLGRLDGQSIRAHRGGLAS